MSFWKNITAAVAGWGGNGAADRDPGDDFWYSTTPVSGNTLHITARSVLCLPEVYSSLTVLSDAVGSLPLKIFRRGKNGSRKVDDSHPLARLLGSEANEINTAQELRGQMTWDFALHRNAFAEIIPDGLNPLGALRRIPPECVSAVTLSDGSWAYEISQNGRSRRVAPERIFHLRRVPLTDDNLMGRSLLADSWKTFATALAVQDYGYRFFENDATPGGMIETPDFKSSEDRERFVRRWQQFFAGKGRHRVVMLDGGMKFTAVNIPNDKAQFIETRKEAALALLRLWRMPPHKVGMLDKATFSNIEQQALEFVMDTVIPLVVAWEQAISRCLIFEKEKYFAEHNLAGLLRGDLESRYRAYAIGRQWGWLNINDVRRLENMNAVPGGETYLEPMNMVPAGSGSGAGRSEKDSGRKNGGVPGNQGIGGGRMNGIEMNGHTSGVPAGGHQGEEH